MSRALPQDLDCIVAVEQVTDYLEETMPPPLRTRFEEHLVLCPGCVRYLRQIRAQIRAAGALGEERLPTGEVAARLLQLFHASRKG